MRTFYFVNGKKVSYDEYIAADERNEYNKAIFDKAVEYYKKNVWEWNWICRTTSVDNLAMRMIIEYQNTPEGKEFKKNWPKEWRKSQIRGCLIVFLLVFSIVAAVAISKYFFH